MIYSVKNIINEKGKESGKTTSPEGKKGMEMYDLCLIKEFNWLNSSPLSERKVQKGSKLTFVSVLYVACLRIRPYSALQCLLNTHPQTKFIISEQYLKEINKNNALGTLGHIIKKYVVRQYGVISIGSSG